MAIYVLNSQYPEPGGTVPQPQVRNLNLHRLISPAGAVTHGRAVGELTRRVGGRRCLFLRQLTTFLPTRLLGELETLSLTLSPS